MSIQQMLERVSQSVEQQRAEIQAERLRRDEQERLLVEDLRRHDERLRIQDDGQRPEQQENSTAEERRHQEDLLKIAAIEREQYRELEFYMKAQELRIKEEEQRLEKEKEKRERERERRRRRKQEQEREREREQERAQKERERYSSDEDPYEQEFLERSRRHSFANPYQYAPITPISPVPPSQYLSPYMFAPTPGGFYMHNISASAVSLGSAPVSISNWNSGNITNTIITNPKPHRKKPRSRDDSDL